MRLTTVAFALFASLAMAAPSPAGEVAAAAAEIDARGSCPPGCACDASICRCASCNENGCYWYDLGKC
ncbi:hypothetical protein B0T18DRAFT_432829 [Schizothecium vesticola]|uniref:Uncharacterized protein n=1 Tax=Schizothecium vesticola TaxID=314040 RepID=A0AA40BPD8_9PEZI|nr:hypothetical protein B0T18DRAFT_432829 [Schizothecium vesticola]